MLDEWLDRNADYDVALRNLYTGASRRSARRSPRRPGTAVEAEAAARARLPPDTRGLVVIMSDIGRAGLNEAVIGIEEARGKLTDALDASEPPRRAGRRERRTAPTPVRGYTEPPNR